MDSDISDITNFSLKPTDKDFKKPDKIENKNCYNIVFIFIIVSIIILIICFAISYSEYEWYQELNNYSWSSNMLIMGIILAIIVIIMSICTGIAYKDCKDEHNKSMILFTYVASSLVLIMWFYVFYNAKNLDNAFYIGILFFFIAFLQTYFVWKANQNAGYGMILYMLWALFAVFITWNISNTNIVDV